MEMLVGISLEDEAGLKDSGTDLEELARRGANMYLDMIFRDGFYHADPHPGNLMVLSGGVIGVLDCGMVGRIDEHLRGEIEGLLLALITKDTEEVVDVVTRVGSVPVGLDRDALRSDLGLFIADYAGQSLRNLDLGRALEQMIDIIHRYQIILPPACTLLLKTLVMLEGTSRRLSPSFSLVAMIQPYQAKAFKRRFSLERTLEKLRRAYRDWDRLLEALPRDAADIVRQARNGTFQVRHEHPRLEATIHRLVLGALTAALFVGSALLWSNGVAPTVWGVSVFGAAGTAAAVALGYKLVRIIGRAEEDRRGR
jgi:ubiquinone biosynthesis protein